MKKNKRYTFALIIGLLVTIIMIIAADSIISLVNNDSLKISWKRSWHINSGTNTRKGSSFVYKGYTYIEEIEYNPYLYVNEKKWYYLDDDKLELIGQMDVSTDDYNPKPFLWFKFSYNVYAYLDENNIPIIMTCRRNMWVREDIKLPNFYDVTIDNVIFSKNLDEYIIEEDNMLLCNIYDFKDAVEEKVTYDKSCVEISYRSNEYSFLYYQGYVKKIEDQYYVIDIVESMDDDDKMLKIPLSSKFQNILSEKFG